MPVKTKRKLVISADEIPDFDAMTREEEAHWWETHKIADHLWEEVPEEEIGLSVDEERRKHA